MKQQFSLLKGLLTAAFLVGVVITATGAVQMMDAAHKLNEGSGYMFGARAIASTGEILFFTGIVVIGLILVVVYFLRKE